jgi:hypothetical protein
MWCPSSDSNREPPASKAVTSTSWARGALLDHPLGFEPKFPDSKSGVLPLDEG